MLGQMTVQELGNHAVQRVVGLYSTSSLRSVRYVRMNWYWIGTRLVLDRYWIGEGLHGLANLVGKH